jgi:hypothetical protein
MLNSSMAPLQRKTDFVLMIFFTLVMSLLIALSGYYDGLNADTVVAYMNSSVYWTPYFWDQDRYGMLIPTLTRWIHDPLLNMVAQNVLHIACSIFSFFLLARYLFPRQQILEIGAVATIGYVTLSGLPDIKEFLTPWQIYTPALALGLLGLLVLPNWRRAIPLAFLAGWCNFAIAVLLGILVLANAANLTGQRGFREIRRRFLHQSLFIGLTFLSGWILKIPYSGPGSSGYRFSEPFEAIQGWILLLRDYFTTAPWTSPWLPLFPGALALLVLAWVALFDSNRFERRPEIWRAFIAGTFTALAYAFLIGATQFAQDSGYPRRYLIPSFMVWLVACSGLTLGLLPKSTIAFLRQNRLALGLIMIIVILCRFGIPSIQSVSQSAARRLEARYNQIPLSCTHVAGNYYRVWESVFYSRLKGDRPLWGITYRSRITRNLWALENFKNPKICYWQDNEDEAQEFLHEFGIEGLQKRRITDEMVELSLPQDSIAGR